MNGDLRVAYRRCVKVRAHALLDAHDAVVRSNEVLVSSTLRDLVIESGLEFEERGAHHLKRVPGEWRLYAVTSP
jgi:hypothetical protein